MILLSLGVTFLLMFGIWLVLRPLFQNTEALPNWHKKGIWSIAITIPLFSLSLYFFLGTPEFAEVSFQKAPAEQVSLVEKLEEKLQKNPKDFAGWQLLARSHMATEDYFKAVSAYQKAHELKPNNLDTLLGYADALSITQGGQLAGKPTTLLKQALKQSPENTMALWLLGMAEKQQNNYEKAGEYWQKLYGLLPNDAPDKPIIAKLIKSVGLTPKQSTNSTSEPKADLVNFTLEFSENSFKKLRQQTAFLYAKAPGQPMPILAKKIQITAQTMQVALNATDSLGQPLAFDTYQQLQLGLRISESASQQTKIQQEKTISAPFEIKLIINN